MRVLLTNDDGYLAHGLICLKAALHLATDWEIWMLAPDRQRSATSMSLSIGADLLLTRLDETNFHLDGYPADCVNVALSSDRFPEFDLVVSGINEGPNLGDDVHYSGTVAGARQAAIKNIPAIAISSPVHTGHADKGMRAPAKLSVDWIKKNFTELTIGIVYNMNFPEFPLELDSEPEILFCAQGRRTYHDHYSEQSISSASIVLKMQDTHFGHVEEAGSDFEAVLEGRIAITPLSTYTTDTGELSRWRKKQSNANV